MENVRFLLADDADKITLLFDMTGFGLSNVRRHHRRSSTRNGR